MTLPGVVSNSPLPPIAHPPRVGAALRWGESSRRHFPIRVRIWVDRGAGVRTVAINVRRTAVSLLGLDWRAVGRAVDDGRLEEGLVRALVAQVRIGDFRPAEALETALRETGGGP